MAKKEKRHKLYHSFRYAFQGLASASQSETNWKIGLVEAACVIFLGYYFKITKEEWMTVIILIGVVLMAELFNSAVETIVDSFTSSHHPGAKYAKDIAAGAVVLIIISAAIVGGMIFLPYFVTYLKLR